ncbi:hypothetical protein SAMN05421878_11412 [Actinobaculum suis]|uniref:Uncharacterized protein n=1 Tax=Actinobaculum suis TaxID=1657 RepID=A0A1G7DZV7_9ACTO|nr:hypothetical protein [Actinobaculum suis]MDY5153260.1 hypothetical protein [Actinobaculum suis]SDE57023.1 hypothetical protein SAMN05421878_11412 [Actinobaculum suis]
MTIQLQSPSDLNSGTQVNRDAYLGFDLSLLGARRRAELPAIHADMRQVGSYVQASHRGGLDFATLNTSFLMRSDADESGMDAARTVAMLGQAGIRGMAFEVPANPRAIATLAQLNPHNSGESMLEIAVTPQTDLPALVVALRGMVARGYEIMPRVLASDVQKLDIKKLCSIATAIRLRAQSPHDAREARYALRSMARAEGREIPVLLEMGIVISGTRPCARERVHLLHEMNEGCRFGEIASVVGTVYDVADATEQWIGMGACDGVIYIPASAVTDFASIIRGVIPLLNGRVVGEE